MRLACLGFVLLLAGCQLPLETPPASAPSREDSLPFVADHRGQQPSHPADFEVERQAPAPRVRADTTPREARTALTPRPIAIADIPRLASAKRPTTVVATRRSPERFANGSSLAWIRYSDISGTGAFFARLDELDKGCNKSASTWSFRWFGFSKTAVRMGTGELFDDDCRVEFRQAATGKMGVLLAEAGCYAFRTPSDGTLVVVLPGGASVQSDSPVSQDKVGAVVEISLVRGGAMFVRVKDRVAADLAARLGVPLSVAPNGSTIVVDLEVIPGTDAAPSLSLFSGIAAS